MSLPHHIHNQHIRIHSDCLTAISYVTSMGGCHSEKCDRITEDIWAWAIIDHNIWLSAVHTPGKINVVVDKLSCYFNMVLVHYLSTLLQLTGGNLLTAMHFLHFV